MFPASVLAPESALELPRPAEPSDDTPPEDGGPPEEDEPADEDDPADEEVPPDDEEPPAGDEPPDGEEPSNDEEPPEDAADETPDPPSLMHPPVHERKRPRTDANRRCCILNSSVQRAPLHVSTHLCNPALVARP